jgi:hypothetical protein
MAASIAASAVLTISREWIATDTVDLPTANFQASGDISPSKVMQSWVLRSPGRFGASRSAKYAGLPPLALSR